MESQICLIYQNNKTSERFKSGLVCFTCKPNGHNFYFFLINLFILFIYYFCLRWVFVAARGLFSSWGERGLLFLVVRRFLIAVASLVAEHRL